LEVVVDGETGYLVPFTADETTGFPAKPDQFARDLAAKISELLADPEKCRRFGEAGRRRVEENFSWSKIAEQTIGLYQRLRDGWHNKGGQNLSDGPNSSGGLNYPRSLEGIFQM